MTAALDVEKFAKVQTLAREGATAGERAAASSRLDAMAKAAGMTLNEAMRQATMTAPERALAEQDRRRWERMRAEPRRRDRRRELAAQHGGDEHRAEEVVAAETEREAAIREAIQPHIVTRKTTGWHIGSIAGWDGGRNMPEFLRRVIEGAFPMPQTVTDALAEYRAWDRLHGDRDAFNPYYDAPVWDRAREHVLETALDSLPAASLDDILARLDWMEDLHERGFSRDVLEDAAWLATLRADVIRLAEGNSSPVQNGQAEGSADRAPERCGRDTHTVHFGHLTASARRALVLSMLDSPETSGLSDREIARRTGVSPTTVGKLRRAAR